MTNKKFAAFDIDGTLHQSALGVELLLQLSREGVIAVDLEDHYATLQAHEPHLRLPYFREHFVPIFHTFLPGTAKQTLEDTGKRLAQIAYKNISSTMQREITTLKDRGYFLLAISNSPAVAVQPLANLLKFDAWQAGEFEYDSAGYFLQPVHRTANERHKGNLLTTLTQHYHLNWQDSTGYGDGIEDLPMLELVGRPVAVNPTAELRVIASMRGWRIIEQNHYENHP